jgi:aspartyl-tRNA(Asn)/glutamyl-tRNA(Gln) amidotransferase subunit B
MAEIVQMVGKSKIIEDGVVKIIRDLQDKKDISPKEIVLAKGLGKAEDDAVQKALREAVAESAAAVADYWAGSERALNFIVGLVAKKTRWKADAGEVHRMVKEEVETV